MTRDEAFAIATEFYTYGGVSEREIAFARVVAKAASAAEREACAKVCDTYEEWCGPWGQNDNLYAATESAKEIAAAIRARGQA